jgi:kynurenine formamidase
MCSPNTILAALDGADTGPGCGCDHLGHTGDHAGAAAPAGPSPAAAVLRADADVPEAPRLGGIGRRRMLRAALGGALGLAGVAVAPAVAAAQPVADGPVTPAAARRTIGFDRVVDLTHPLSPDFPVFEMFVRPPEVQQWRNLDEHGFNTNEWRFNEHTGTHIDVPAHAQNGAVTVDQLPLENFIAPLAVVRYAERADRDNATELTVADIEAWERRNGRLPRGAFVAADASWYRRVGTPAFLNLDVAAESLSFPGVSPEAADFLITQRSIVGFGTDTISLDHSSRLFPLVHRMLLTTGRYGLEAMANLDEVPDTGATLVLGVPKLRGGFGAPVRAMALF